MSTLANAHGSREHIEAGCGPVAIQVEGLVKYVRDPMSQRRRDILRGIDLEITQGEVFGFLGVNGAGKTTTLHCMVGLSRPNLGRVRVAGGDPTDPDVRRGIGFLPERPSFYDYLTGEEFLDLIGRLCGMDAATRRRRIAELLALLHVQGRARTPLRKLSKGELQRLGIAQAVLHDPAIVVLDEPMSGLDPIGRRDVRDLVEELRRRGRTVVFSSHVVPDVEAICDRVGIVHEGRLLRCGRIEEITSVKLRGVDVQLRGISADFVSRLLGAEDRIEPLGPTLRVRVAEPARVDRLLVRVLQAGGQLVALERRRERLEDYLVRTACQAEVR